MREFASEMDASMQTMMRGMHAAGHSGNPDIDFLAMMIPHHQGAIDMARLLLIHGRDPATRRLAEDIIAGSRSRSKTCSAALPPCGAGARCVSGTGGYARCGAPAVNAYALRAV